MQIEVDLSHYLNSVQKKLFDYLFSIVGLVVLILIFPLIAPLVLLTSKGGVFHRSERLGKNGKRFKLLKIRTMFVLEQNDEIAESLRTQTNDPRITNFGKYLRKTYIDELPQFINVLRSEMSIVGPRPEFAILTKKISDSNSDFKKRLAALPGITGLSQIRFSHSHDDKSAAKRINYDLLYIKKASLWLDIKIILSTLTRLTRLKGE